MSELNHLKRLSEVKSNKAVKFLTPAVTPGSHCPMHTALVLANTVEGLSSLLVGTPECGNYSRMVIQKPEGKNGELHWLYMLDSHEVVFGCREGVINALKEMDRSGAKVILLIITCVPELIGEDIEGIVHELQPELSARLIYVMLAHFKCNSYPSGSWKTIEAIAGLIEPKQIQTRTVNVLGRPENEDHVCMPTILTKLEQQGIRLRYLAPGSALKEFLYASDAELNLVLSPFFAPFADRMEGAVGTPQIRLDQIYSVTEIDDAYRNIADSLCVELHNAFDDEREQLLSLEDKLKEVSLGLRYISTQIGLTMPLPIATYLASFDMEPIVLHVEEFFPADRIFSKQLVSKGYNPYICHMVNLESDRTILESLSPDFILGNLTQGGSSIPCVQGMYEIYGMVGYERTALLLKKILEVMQQSTIQSEGGNLDGVTSI